MNANPYESPQEVGFEAPEDSNERVGRYMIYTSIVLAACLVTALVGVMLRVL